MQIRREPLLAGEAAPVLPGVIEQQRVEHLGFVAQPFGLQDRPRHLGEPHPEVGIDDMDPLVLLVARALDASGLCYIRFILGHRKLLRRLTASRSTCYALRCLVGSGWLVRAPAAHQSAAFPCVQETDRRLALSRSPVKTGRTGGPDYSATPLLCSRYRSTACLTISL